jgi:starch synthase (maltosyl-transferring)
MVRVELKLSDKYRMLFLERKSLQYICMLKHPHLNDLREQLQNKSIEVQQKKTQYCIPCLWLIGSQHAKTDRLIYINPFEFFLGGIKKILDEPHSKMRKTNGGEWTREAVIYNLMTRTTCAFDHNQNGKLDLPVNSDGWRETGTFLKTLVLLPYIKSLGVNTIHLLPITSIGSDGNKGTLGSPYAIKNPCELDPKLAEPNIGLGAEKEYKAFVEAAHHLGMRVVVEFVFRISAKDGDWVKEHPDWFYWIKETTRDRQSASHDEASYGSPIFSKEELQHIAEQVARGKFENLSPPHKVYRDMFTEPPPRTSIVSENGKYIGVLSDGTRARVPGAFADWPPDDSQPPWNDVTYLKMYVHPNFNYMAYNTLRMYDRKLAQPQNINQPLWEKISNIIPHYQTTYGIDGVMIDMGHALPIELKQEMIRRAREIDPDFAFWDENFSVTEKSVKEGYNAVVGYQWADQHRPDEYHRLLKRFSEEGYPLPFFATPESHNTPRAAVRDGNIRYSKYAWALSNFVPAIPFIHSGFELGEKFPINTGLGFTKEELNKFPSEKLPLFTEYAFDWLNGDHIIDWIRKVARIRDQHSALITNPLRESFEWIETHRQDILAFRRVGKQETIKLLIIANSHMKYDATGSCTVASTKNKFIDWLSDEDYHIKNGILEFTLTPGQVCVFEEA